MLTVESRGPEPFDFGAAAAAGNLSAEICDRCGGKGDPLGPAPGVAAAARRRASCLLVSMAGRPGTGRVAGNTDVPHWPRPVVK